MTNFLSDDKRNELELIVQKTQELRAQNEGKRLELVAQEITRQQSRKALRVGSVLITLLSGIGFSLFLSFLFSGQIYPQTLSAGEKFFCGFPVGAALLAANIQRIVLFSDNDRLINNKGY